MDQDDLDLSAALGPVGTAPLASDEPPLKKIGSWDGEGGEAATDGDAEYGTVTYFDEPIRVALDPLSLELSFQEFMGLASELEGPEDPRSFGAVHQFLKALIHPDDFSKFWRLVRVNRQNVMAQVGFGKWVVEQVAGHPTEQRSDSAGGPLQTPPNSVDDVSSRVQHRLEEQARPDLALVVLRRREAVAASSQG